MLLQGQNLARLCSELEHMECEKLSSFNLRLRIDPDASVIMQDAKVTKIAVQLFSCLHSSSDVEKVFGLMQSASEKMRAASSVTLDDLVSSSKADQLLQKASVARWTSQQTQSVLPDYPILERVLQQKTFDSQGEFGLLKVKFLCVCNPLEYKSLSRDSFCLQELLCEKDLEHGYLIAVGQRHSSKPLS